MVRATIDWFPHSGTRDPSILRRCRRSPCGEDRQPWQRPGRVQVLGGTAVRGCWLPSRRLAAQSRQRLRAASANRETASGSKACAATFPTRQSSETIFFYKQKPAYEIPLEAVPLTPQLIVNGVA